MALLSVPSLATMPTVSVNRTAFLAALGEESMSMSPIDLKVGFVYGGNGGREGGISGL